MKLKIAQLSSIALAAFLAIVPATHVHAGTQNFPTDDTLTFGIVPQQSASRLAAMWGPLLSRLSDDLGVKIKFATTKDIPTFEACLAAGAYDLAYMNPVHYTIFSKATGYRALARQSDKKLKGLLVVRNDSQVRDLEDLSGETVAFPSIGAFGASVVPRAEISSRGINIETDYVKSHDSVYRAVVAGLRPAGGGVLRTFNAIDDDLRAQLRVIYKTEEYTPHAIAAHPALAAEQVDALRKALMSMATFAPDAVASVGMNGFETAVDQDWDDVRALNLSARETGILTESEIACPSD